MYAATSTRLPRLRPLGLGVTQQEYSACVAAQTAYQADLAAWRKEQTAYNNAVKANSAAAAGAAASYAAAQTAYQAAHVKWVKVKAAHDAWAAGMAGKYSGLAQSVAALLRRFPNVQLAAGAPACIAASVRQTYENRCYLQQQAIKGLGAYNWDPYNACFTAAYPVCTPDPAEPPRPGPEPQPPRAPTVTPVDVPQLRPQPVAPPGCTAPAAVTPPAPTPVPPDVISPLPPTEASLGPASHAGGGLLLAGILAVVVGGGIYLVARRKRAA